MPRKSSAPRVRLHRERRRAGAHLVTIELYREGVGKLVQWGWLDGRHRDNRERVRDAFIAFSMRAFEVKVSPSRVSPMAAE